MHGKSRIGALLAVLVLLACAALGLLHTGGRVLEGDPGAAAAPPPGRAALPAGFLEKVDRSRDLHGVVVSVTGRRVPGADVRALYRPAQGFEFLDLAYVRETRTVAVTRSGPEGEFRLSLRRGMAVDLRVEAEGFPAWVLPARNAGEYVPVRLQPGADLQGEVVRAEDGAPAACRLRGFAPASLTPEFETVTGPRGRFRAVNLAPGLRFVEITPEGGGTPAWRSVRLEGGGEHFERFKILAGTTFSGRITDARTGAPVAGAEVSETWAFWAPARSDADGRYELSGVGGDDVTVLVVRAAGYGRAERRVSVAGSRVAAADVQLQPGRPASGRVFDRLGLPVAGAYVAAIASVSGETGRQTDWRSTRTERDGAFLLDDLRPDLSHVLFVQSEGHGSVMYEFPPTEAGAGSLDLGDVFLPPAGRIAGTLRDDSGRGLAGTAVVLTGWNDDRGRWNSDFQPGVERHVARREARTDDLGRFAFGDLAPGTWRVRPEFPSGGESQAREVRLAPGESREELDFLRSERGVLSGIVLDPHGRPVPGAQVYARPEPPLTGLGVLARSRADGSFRIQGLEPGTYSVAVRVERPSGGETLAPVRATGVVTGGAELSFSLPVAATLSGTVLDAAGQGVDGAEVQVFDQQGGWVTRTRSGPGGGFRVSVPESGVFTLWAFPKGGSGPATRAPARLEGVAAPRHGVELRFPDGP